MVENHGAVLIHLKRLFHMRINIMSLFPSLSVAVSSLCNRPLGMRDGAISETNVTASSANQEHPPHEARPHGKGWCALKDDQHPFLQVKICL